MGSIIFIMWFLSCEFYSTYMTWLLPSSLTIINLITSSSFNAWLISQFIKYVCNIWDNSFNVTNSSCTWYLYACMDCSNVYSIALSQYGQAITYIGLRMHYVIFNACNIGYDPSYHLITYMHTPIWEGCMVWL